MTFSMEQKINQLVASIKVHRVTLAAVAKHLRTPEICRAFDKWDHDSWCLKVTSEALVRLRLFIEQDSNFIGTISTIAVARYIFELSVWLHLFKRDSRYGLVYYAQLIDTQNRYWKDCHAQIDREIELLQHFEKKESDARDEVSNQINPTTLKAVVDMVDKQAARRFSLYAEQAKANGYGFQAYLLKKKVVPKIKERIVKIVSEKNDFNSNVSQNVKDLIPSRWVWRQMAEKVDLTDEYDYIYTCSSKILHATPASITTTHRDLEPAELVAFLKYINVKIQDLIELAQEYS